MVCTLANYETGRTELDIDTIEKLINFYNTDANWLLSINIPDEDGLREAERLLDVIKGYVELDSKANKEEILKRFCILLYDIF